MTAVKRIIRYVNNTLEYEIWYSKDTNSNLVGFSDADWAGNADDRKSTSRGCFMWEITWCLGFAKNRTLFLSLQLRLST